MARSPAEGSRRRLQAHLRDVADRQAYSHAEVPTRHGQHNLPKQRDRLGLPLLVPTSEVRAAGQRERNARDPSQTLNAFRLAIASRYSWHPSWSSFPLRVNDRNGRPVPFPAAMSATKLQGSSPSGRDRHGLRLLELLEKCPDSVRPVSNPQFARTSTVGGC